MISLDDMLPFGEFADNILKIQKSFSVSLAYEKTTGCQIFNSLAFYNGKCAPKIRFSLTADGQEQPFYESHDYIIGSSLEFSRKAWRVPPLFLPKTTLTVNIQIPAGTVLHIKDFTISSDDGYNDWRFGLRHNAHLGFWGIAPNNTMPAFELAAACKFPSCIVVPKVTLDGVIVCIHDDTINATARDINGKAPSEPIYVWDKTYDELLEWEYGSYKNEIYKGAKLPLLTDFFDLCAKTGMRPMFSTHPGLTTKQWKEVREMLELRGLLNCFHIKSFDINILKSAYSVFGTDIEGYTFDIDTWEDSHIDVLINSGIDYKSCRVGIEIKFGDYTKQIAEKIRSAGFFASAWDIKRRDFEEYNNLILWGVTEFTEDYHCSMGLNY